MARISSYSSTTPTSETNIAFFSAGGHSHDGSNSSLIDTSKYSIFDFDQGLIPTNSERAQAQQRNKINFEDNVKEILRTAGIELSANSINATQIIAGSITSEEIAANTITTNNLVSDILQSDNYSYTSGTYSDSGTFFDLSDGAITSKSFAIDGTGNASFKGTLEASDGIIAGFSITTEGFQTDGFQSASVIDPDTGNTYTYSGSLAIDNSGDIEIRSNPSTGGYAGRYHVSKLVGEWLTIDETESDYTTKKDVYTYLGGTSFGTEPYEMKLILASKNASSNNYSSLLSNDYNSELILQRDDGGSTFYRASMFAGNSYLNLSFYSGSTSNEPVELSTSDNGRLRLGDTSGAYMMLRSNSNIYSSGGDIYVNGNKVWHSANDGAGSGLHADKLDGYHASDFALAHSHNYLSTTGGSVYGGVFIGGLLETYNINSNTLYNRNIQNGTERSLWINSAGQIGCQLSTYKVKENIYNLEYGLKEVLQMRPVHFRYKESPDIPRIGLIAEELNGIIPESVVNDLSDPNFLPSINYDNLVVPLIAAVQQLSNKVDELQSQIDSLS